MTIIHPACVCGHQLASHRADGCLLCDALGRHCDGYWTKQERDDALDSALADISKALSARRSDSHRKDTH